MEPYGLMRTFWKLKIFLCLNKGLLKRALSVSEVFNVSVMFDEFSPDSLRTSLFFRPLM